MRAALVFTISLTILAAPGPMRAQAPAPAISC